MADDIKGDLRQIKEALVEMSMLLSSSECQMNRKALGFGGEVVPALGEGQSCWCTRCRVRRILFPGEKFDA